MKKLVLLALVASVVAQFQVRADNAMYKNKEEMKNEAAAANAKFHFIAGRLVEELMK